jgi:hypothetical protein
VSLREDLLAVPLECEVHGPMKRRRGCPECGSDQALHQFLGYECPQGQGYQVCVGFDGEWPAGQCAGPVSDEAYIRLATGQTR